MVHIFFFKKHYTVFAETFVRNFHGRKLNLKFTIFIITDHIYLHSHFCSQFLKC